MEKPAAANRQASEDCTIDEQRFLATTRVLDRRPVHHSGVIGWASAVPRPAPLIGWRIVPAHVLVQPSDPPSKKVLVLGSTDHPAAVTAYSWAGLPRFINVTDFDVVIVNAASVAEGDRLDPAHDKRPQIEQIGRLWFAGGTEIIVITSVVNDDEIDPLYWCPLRVERDPEPGTVIQDIHPDWAWYLDRLRAYGHFFTGSYRRDIDPGWYFREIGIPADVMELKFETLANARHGRPVAVAMTLEASQTYHGGQALQAESAPAFVLPTLMDRRLRAAVARPSTRRARRTSGRDCRRTKTPARAREARSARGSVPRPPL
jgi:hypothetical protein